MCECFVGSIPLLLVVRLCVVLVVSSVGCAVLFLVFFLFGGGRRRFSPAFLLAFGLLLFLVFGLFTLLAFLFLF